MEAPAGTLLEGATWKPILFGGGGRKWPAKEKILWSISLCIKEKVHPKANTENKTNFPKLTLQDMHKHAKWEINKLPGSVAMLAHKHGKQL